MPGTSYPTDSIQQAQTTLAGWQQIDPPLPAIGELSQTAMTANLEQAQSLQAQMNTLEAQLNDLRNQRAAVHVAIWDMVKRVRSGVKALYGDDSTQYDLVGGTRLSERKRSGRKPKANG